MRALLASGVLAFGTLAGLTTWAQIAPEIPAGTQIAVLGEVHDNPRHHAEQARLIEQFGPRVVVWEMLAPEQIARADGIDTGDAEALEAALGWTAAGWPDFSMYHPLFVAAGTAGHLGAAVSRDRLRLAMTDGAAAALGASPFDLGPLTPEDQTARETEQARAHCDALPQTLLPGMVEAQRLRDAQMAFVALDALAKGGPVVVITGTGHARTDIGVPALIRAARPDVVVWALGQLEADPGSDAPFDAVNITDPHPRPDPCLVFR